MKFKVKNIEIDQLQVLWQDSKNRPSDWKYMQIFLSGPKPVVLPI